jgi:hypothetical protein
MHDAIVIGVDGMARAVERLLQAVGIDQRSAAAVREDFCLPMLNAGTERSRA